MMERIVEKMVEETDDREMENSAEFTGGKRYLRGVTEGVGLENLGIYEMKIVLAGDHPERLIATMKKILNSVPLTITFHGAPTFNKVLLQSLSN